MNYNHGDQYARLEAIRAYIQGAKDIAREMRQYENRRGASFLTDKIDELIGGLKYAQDDCQELIESVGSELAIEDAQDSMPPMSLPAEPDPFPRKSEFPLQLVPELDEPF